VHEGTDGKSSVDLSISGDITFKDVPSALLYGKDVGPQRKGMWTDLVTATGTWEMPASQGGAYPVITYDVPGGGSQLFYDSYTHKSDVLQLVYGDDGQFEYDFHREGTKSD
jgi:hypothetical protein